ncbi:biotin--[acetyl-CoA-carboxylase] ligase [Granulosicoccus antarcticus]|uniref:Bifunctional ligase/repressor BirA n=1 Tax=Granulosicoccus antarcticus IMCC3135 TaxID=1192854 RepID=A0A2Z2NYD2_9GAMM|nr:biotin--[acetyl-CoA-carboxylase] ligase [Granulosicoccus antarcticus]ASJ76456.1 Bifunctional ligase/repressor BirA [Granulosicoccus antarcticus IMCC3135]
MSKLPDARLIQNQLHKLGHPNVDVHAFEQLDSTSIWLKDNASILTSTDLDRGRDVNETVHLCVTDWQSAGVGRRGRQWQTRPGNITFSVLAQSLRPASELVGISLVTGIAVAECLADNLGVQPQLKWPNDVLLNGAKLGGLLTELSSVSASAGARRVTQLFTGIGINTLHDDEVLGLGIGATSLEEAMGGRMAPSERDVLLAKMVANVLAEHQRFHESGWTVFSERWAALDWLFDREVLIHRENSTEQAVARGVNEQGALLVERAGEILPLFSGNVSIRPTV